MSKSENLNILYDMYRKQFNEEIVLGEGNVDTRLLLIGEAPGREEVSQSKPFVGAAGKNLNEFLDLLGVERESIYITNAIKYRLSKINPKTGRVANRPAVKEDIEQNRDFLLKEIEIINPYIIVTLGNVPLKAVTGDKNINIGPVHGSFMHIRVLDHNYKLFPLYHPASIIYNRSLKDTYISDIKKLGDFINKL